MSNFRAPVGQASTHMPHRVQSAPISIFDVVGVADARHAQRVGHHAHLQALALVQARVEIIDDPDRREGAHDAVGHADRTDVAAPKPARIEDLDRQQRRHPKKRRTSDRR